MSNNIIKTVVIKIGTNTLTDDSGQLNRERLNRLAKEISKIKADKLIVTSGAIGAGSSALGIKGKTREVTLRQATASIGQGLLMAEWTAAFSKYKQKVAQLLLTHDVFNNRKSYLNLRNCVSRLLKLNVIPIINENDPIAIDEIDKMFGDNDKLSALVASKIGADLLIMLSDVDGFYTGNPKKDKSATKIAEIRNIDAGLLRLAGKAGSTNATGGMITKLNAAKICMDAGVTMVITDGSQEDVIGKILDNVPVGTVFIPGERISNKKNWIRLAKSKGTVTVDTGAKIAILSGRNLLPAGVHHVDGQFEINDVIELVSDGVFAKALSDYGSADLKKIMGKNSSEIKDILGYEGCDNITRRENLVILED
ncbi:MAG: glutamate 5-kinase [archaeon]